MSEDSQTVEIKNDSVTGSDNTDTIRQGTREDLLKLKILWELLEVLPIDPGSYHILDQSILEDNAIHMPFTTAIINGEEVLIGGFRRMDIVCKHTDCNFMFYIKTLAHIHTLDQATDWRIKNSRTYRQLNKPYRVKFSLRIRKVYKERAKENQRRGGRKKALSKTDKAYKKTDCWGLLAKDADVSRQFAVDAAFVFDNGNPQEQKDFCEKDIAASTMRKSIEKRLKGKDNDVSAVYVNPASGKYINQIINNNCLATLNDMQMDDINDVAITIFSPPYNVCMNYGHSSKDDLPYGEYIDLLGKAIYGSQLCGRDGMRLCIVISDTFNREAKNGGDFMHNIVKDIGNRVDQLNKHEDCNLLYWGTIHCYKQHSGAIPYIGSIEAPVLKCDADQIIIYMKKQRKLVCQNGINCKPALDSFAADEERNKLIITKQEFMTLTYQTWFINPCTENTGHPARFNPEIPRRLIRLFTNPKDGIVLDPFVGSGTTAEEAKKLKRDFIGIDINPEFCNLAKKRIDAINTTNNE